MAKKELEFSVKFDTQEFDKSINDMQKKLSELYSPSDQMKAQSNTSQRLQQMGMGGIMSGPTQDAMKKATQQSRKELDTLIRDQAKVQRDLGLTLAQHAQGIEKLVKQQQEMVKGSKEELSIQQEIARTKSNSAKLTSEYKQKDTVLNQLLDEKQRTLSEQQKDTPMGRISEIAKKIGPSGMVTGIAGLLGAGVGAAAAGSDIYKYLGQAPIAASAAAGRATQGTFGHEIQSAYGGRTAYELAFAPEKARAASMAGEATKRVEQTQYLDLGLKMAGGGLLGAATGGLAGAKLGGMAGSFFGPMGSAAGAGIGGALGAGVGALGAGLTDKSVLLSGVSSSADKQRQAELAQTFADNFQKALEGEKLQNPLKKAAADEYYQNYGKNLESQRALGLNFGSFHGAGGFTERSINAGFTPEMGMGASSAILGAGGSTAMARQSTFGLQAQRGFNLTNANQVLGMLSGSVGGGGAQGAAVSKQATIDILAEGIKKGFGTDDFAEENRRFVQATAEAVVASGATSQGAISDVAAKFAGYNAEPTTKGIQAAQSAYQVANQGMSQTSGPGGAMRAAGFMRDAELSKLAPMDRASLMNIPADQMNEDHPVVQDIARRLGMDPKKLVSKVGEVNRGSLHRLGEGDALTQRVRSLRKSSQEKGRVQGFQDTQQMEAEKQHLATIFNVEHPGMTAKELNSIVEGTTSLNPDEQSKAQERMRASEDITKKIESKETGKTEDTTVGAIAEGARIGIQTFRELKDQIVTTAEQVGKFNNNLKEIVKTAMSLPEAQRAGLFQTLFPSKTGGTQVQSGKPSQ